MRSRSLPVFTVSILKQAIGLAVLSLTAWASWAEDSVPAEPMLLQDLIREVLDRNPEIQIARRGVEAKRARVPQTGALPDPMLMYGVINEGRPVPFQTLGEKGFSEVYVGITQDLPFPGKRAFREQVAGEELSAAEWAYEATRRRVAAQVAGIYYDLYAVHAEVDILGRSIQLLDQLTKVTRTRFDVGQVGQQDVLDAEVESSRLEERRSLLVQRRATAEAALERLLYRTSSAALGRPVTIVKTPLTTTLEELLERADAESPVLKEKDREVAREERSVDLARRERLPDLGASFTYHNRGGLDPYYAFGGTLMLPIYRARKQNKAVEEAAANLGAARGEADSARAEIRYEVTDAYLIASTTDRLLRLYDEGLLKQSRLALDSAIAQYQVGKVDFLALVTSWRRLLDYDITYHEQLAAHEKALVRLAVHVKGIAGEAF